MKRLSLWIAIFLGLIASVIWIICFAWIFWLLGATNIDDKWNAFMDSIVFDE